MGVRNQPLFSLERFRPSLPSFGYSTCSSARFRGPRKHHSSTSGLPEFDRLPPHMMHMQDNLQRHHLMQGFPSGGPPPHHSPNVNNQISGLIPELNPSQGFPFAHHQPSYGMPPQVLKATELIIQLHRQWVKLRNLTLVLDTVKLSFEKDEKKKKYLLLAASDVDAFSVQCGFESVCYHLKFSHSLLSSQSDMRSVIAFETENIKRKNREINL
ncbi:hypothetical protein Bca52824_053524 [Brassica carinata]|uniref:Uncharacterized protein n=1 Tax=Brassica carinata TaxID=52824 RepID=A0A8X7R4D2_BRACI|nr:hypothetical protein Bca52824_053524 [Brassica carinata]